MRRSNSFVPRYRKMSNIEQGIMNVEGKQDPEEGPIDFAGQLIPNGTSPAPNSSEKRINGKKKRIELHNSRFLVRYSIFNILLN